MLIDQKAFNLFEEKLKENGELEKFEKENGKIRGRMMITSTEIPDGIILREFDKGKLQAFEASFDFYDTTLGITIVPETGEIASGVWIRKQIKDAPSPDPEFIKLFVKTLLENLNNLDLPIYSLVNDSNNLTLSNNQVKTL